MRASIIQRRSACLRRHCIGVAFSADSLFHFEVLLMRRRWRCVPVAVSLPVSLRVTHWNQVPVPLVFAVLLSLLPISGAQITFSAANAVSVPSSANNPGSSVAGDLNLDGYTDVVVCSCLSPSHGASLLSHQLLSWAGGIYRWWLNRLGCVVRWSE